MTRRGKVLIALVISIPLVLLGGGLAASADQLSAGEDTAADTTVLSNSGDSGGTVEAKRIQQRERDCTALCLQERVRLCEHDCELADDCEFSCWRDSNVGWQASGENATQTNRACFARRATWAEEAPSVEPPDPTAGIDCFRCDREPLNEYPPNSPWYTGDE